MRAACDGWFARSLKAYMRVLYRWDRAAQVLELYHWAWIPDSTALVYHAMQANGHRRRHPGEELYIAKPW
jgi:hypothetical protein